MVRGSVPAVTFDVGPVKTLGAFKTTVPRARVFWEPGDNGDGGTLYVMQAPNNVKALSVPDPPAVKRPRRTWTATLADGRQLTITREGCSGCGWSFGRYKRRDLVKVASGELRRAT